MAAILFVAFVLVFYLGLWSYSRYENCVNSAIEDDNKRYYAKWRQENDEWFHNQMRIQEQTRALSKLREDNTRFF